MVSYVSFEEPAIDDPRGGPAVGSAATREVSGLYQLYSVLFDNHIKVAAAVAQTIEVQ